MNERITYEGSAVDAAAATARVARVEARILIMNLYGVDREG